MDNSDWNSYIYTDQRSILMELKKRRQDVALKQAVEAFWGEMMPDFLKNDDGPYGFFARPFATPNMETLFFLDIVDDFRVQPLIMEFPDKFVTVNKAKYHLAKPHFFSTSKKGDTVIDKKTLVDFNEWEGKPLKDVVTNTGQNLGIFHKEWLLKEHPELNGRVVDISKWFDTVRKSFDEYYTGFLALGLYHGVIFENFILEDSREREFFTTKVLPGFARIEKEFGIKPLISPILPVTSADLDKWFHYPRNT